MEEMLEMITWSQLNIHAKPMVLVNIKNFFGHFLDWIKHTIERKFHFYTFICTLTSFFLCRTIHFAQ